VHVLLSFFGLLPAADYKVAVGFMETLGIAYNMAVNKLGIDGVMRPITATMQYTVTTRHFGFFTTDSNQKGIHHMIKISFDAQGIKNIYRG
jgi:hypothetical protein